MEENLPDNIDQQFKDGLQSFQQKPSKDIWKNIETQLDKDERRFFFIRYRLLLSISACLIVLFLFWGLLFHQTRKNVDTAEANTPPIASPKSVTANHSTARSGVAGSSYLNRSGKISLSTSTIHSEQTN